MNKLFILALMFTLNAYTSEKKSASFGRITDVKGAGFISFKGKTQEITKGAMLEVGSEVVIEHQGQVSFTDNADHRYFIGNASSVSISSDGVELRSGDIWFQSLNKTDEYKINTANASIVYQGGEGIISYDSVKGKTQLMVINGMMKLANYQAPDLNLSISEGHFSFVDNNYESGAPRDPTPVGEKTYKQLVGLFPHVTPIEKSGFTPVKEHVAVEVKREIASVTSENAELEKYKNSMLDKPSSVLETKTKRVLVVKKIKVAKSIISVKSNTVVTEVHIYGQSKVAKTRAPASVLDQEVPTEKVVIPNKESSKLLEELNKL
jgi:hypothetical protein